MGLGAFSPGNIQDAELRRVANQLTEAAGKSEDAIYLRELNVAPAKVREGMIALADGTNWNPGSGAGVYAYYGGSWVKLG